MERQPATPPAAGATAAIVGLGRRQHGVVAASQLGALGVSREELRGRVRAGWLCRVHRGVYAIGGRPGTRRGVWMAAVLACGDGAALSHAAAAALWGIRPPGGGPVDVTVPTLSGRSKRAGIILHRSGTLVAADTARREGIAVTGPARTIVDLARSGLTGRALERAVDEAERLRICDAEALGAALARCPAGAGCTALKRLLEEHAIGSTLTRSELEERFLALMRDRGLPAPLVNARVLGLTVDFLWPRAGVIAELDGRAGHDTHRGFQDDRDRDSLLAAHGYRTLRFTWWDVSRRPAVVADRVRKVLLRS